MNSPKKLSSRVSGHQKSNGFALIIALTLMSFMVVLILSLATFLNVEMHTSTHQNRMNEARSNALFGAQIALGQLQMLAGPDQRVTAPATVAYPQKESPGEGEMWDIYRENASGMPPSGSASAPDTWSTYLIEDYDNSKSEDRDSWNSALVDWWEGKNPHWIGVYKSNKLDKDGEWLNAADFNREQTPHWLISGNERYTEDNIGSQITPDTVLDPDDSSVAILVGYGSAAPNKSADGDQALSSDGLDGRVLAPKIDITNSDSIVTGQYAYWVGDENTKANFAIIDPYYDAASGSTEERYRLQVPQRLGWEQITGYKEIFDEFDGDDSAQEAMINNKYLQLIETTSQIVLTNPAPDDDSITEKYQDAAKINFHHITGFSKGLFTDTVLGGLQKDLTRYFEDGASATNGGISDDKPIPAPNDDDIFNYDNDPRFGLFNEGFPVSDLNVPTWRNIREWYTNEVQDTGDGEGQIRATESTAPVITQIRLFVGFSKTGDQLRLNVLPQVVLWNPYDTGLEQADYDIRIKFSPNLTRFRVASATTATQSKSELNPVTVREYSSGDNYHHHRMSRSDADSWQHNDREIVKDEESIVVTYHEDALHMHPQHANLSAVTPDSQYPENEDIFFDSYNIRIFPEDNELSLRIRNQDFQAGEHLMFSVGEDHKIDENNESGVPVAIVELQNVFDLDAPASAYHHFATLDYAPGALTKTTYWADNAVFLPEPATEFQVRFFLNEVEIRDYGSFGSLAGGGGFMSNFNRSRNASVLVDQPMIWPNVYDSDYFSANIVGDRDPNLNSSGARSGSPDIPIMLVGETYLDPLYFRGSGTIDSVESGATSFRPFANYNIMAKQFTSNNPMVDGVRGAEDWRNANTGGEKLARFEAINGIQSRNNSQPSVSDAFGSGNIGEDKWSSWAHTPTNNKEAGKVIVDRGQPWNAFDQNRRAELLNGRTVGFNFIQQTKLPEGLARNNWANPKVDALSKVPVRLAYRPEFDIVSIGQLQQVNLGEFMWQPAYVIGNSEASPYIDRDRIAGLTSRPVFQYYNVDDDNLPLRNADGSYAGTKTSWASEGLGNNRFNHLLDISYLLNESLWDRYFFSTIPGNGSVPLDNSEPMGNSRIKFNVTDDVTESDVRDFDNAAAYVYNNGAFNVNSTSVEAWKALLTAFRDIQLRSLSNYNDTNPRDTVPISRSLEPLNGDIAFTSDSSTNSPIDYGAAPSPTGYNNYDKVFGGFRFLTDDMIETLAERIVDEVRLRGPFYSLADFVNRRLDAPHGLSRTEDGRISYSNSHYTDGRKNKMSQSYDALVGLQSINGTIQRALNVSGINGGVNYPDTASHNSYKRYDAMFFPRSYSETGREGWGSDWRWVAYPSMAWYTDSEARAGAPVGEQGLLLSHSPGFVTQADILSMIGPVLRPRGDTFVIRSYGSSINKLTGEVEAEAWLEMTVQRIVEPVKPDSNNPFEPDLANKDEIDVGRKFEIVNFRWLSPEDV
ncbi:hypothetical protein [Cerasicoccus fimbriatus]|uniref:hypothetical protein n=1 Tax=Cerasicoccus fimbriatus TaxID=3014554 RepID=UPI0022B54BCD|nr:hypothetical protein [Cerasicoccus sp. TK19100]